MRNGRLLKAVTGVTALEFEALLPVFDKVHLDSRYQKPRQRAPGGGRKGGLGSARQKLFFLLCYLKVSPTYDLASLLWGADRSRICRWVPHGLPLLEKALGRAGVLPARRIGAVDEFLKAFPETRERFMEGTERPHPAARPKPESPSPLFWQKEGAYSKEPGRYRCREAHSAPVSYPERTAARSMAGRADKLAKGHSPWYDCLGRYRL